MGHNYFPNEKVDLTFDNKLVTNIASDDKGEYNFNFNVPDTTPGNKVITGKGITSMASSTTNYTVATVYSSINLSKYFGNTESIINAIGNGYVPNETISIIINGITIKKIISDVKGKFKEPFILPILSKGNIMIKFMGDHSLSQQQIKFYII